MDNNEDKSADPNSVVLVIHKDFDMGTALYHSWTYEGLVQEVYKVTNNKATHLSKGRFGRTHLSKHTVRPRLRQRRLLAAES